MNPTLHIHLATVERGITNAAHPPVLQGGGRDFTLARMLGSTATTSERHFMALVLTAMALSPSTLRIYAGPNQNRFNVDTKYSSEMYLKEHLPTCDK